MAFVDSVGDFWAWEITLRAREMVDRTVHLPAGDQNKTPVVMRECFFFTSNIFLFKK